MVDNSFTSFSHSSILSLQFMDSSLKRNLSSPTITSCIIKMIKAYLMPLLSLQSTINLVFCFYMSEVGSGQVANILLECEGFFRTASQRLYRVHGLLGFPVLFIIHLASLLVFHSLLFAAHHIETVFFRCRQGGLFSHLSWCNRNPSIWKSFDISFFDFQLNSQ